LPGSPRQTRHLLAEVEGHLDDLVEAGRRAGLDEHTARVRAVERMGPVGGVVPRRRLLPALTPARRRILLALFLVGGVGGVAVGIAGAIAAAVRAVWGDRTIAVVFPEGSYTSADCARWTRLYPNRSCLQAMTADHANDFLLATLACWSVLRRRWWSRAVAIALPPGSEQVVGALLAGLATVAFAGQGLDEVLVTYGRGAGQPFSLAAAACGASIVLALRAGAVRRRPLFEALARER
jgi:hypothetical protein